MPESSKYVQRMYWTMVIYWSKKKWYSAENSPQGAWDHIADAMLLEFAESGQPIFRATTPLSTGNLKSKGHGKLSIHFTAEYPTIQTVFRIIISVNQLSIYGAVANICEEFEAHQDGSGEPEVLMGQSLVLGEIKAEVPLQNEDPSHHQILWQQYMERIESLSPERISQLFKVSSWILKISLWNKCSMSPPRWWITRRKFMVWTKFSSWKQLFQVTIERGNLWKILGIHCKKLTLIVRNLFSAGMRILQGTESLFTIERGNLC